MNAVAHGSRGDSATPPAFSGRNWDQANLYASLGEGHTTPLFSLAERVRAAIQRAISHDAKGPCHRLPLGECKADRRGIVG